MAANAHTRNRPPTERLARIDWITLAFIALYLCAGIGAEVVR